MARYIVMHAIAAPNAAYRQVSYPARFSTIQEAREYIEQEWESFADDDLAWNDENGNGTKAYRDALDAIHTIEPGARIDSPVPGDPRFWKLELSDQI